MESILQKIREELSNINNILNKKDYSGKINDILKAVYKAQSLISIQLTNHKQNTQVSKDYQTQTIVKKLAGISKGGSAINEINNMPSNNAWRADINDRYKKIMHVFRIIRTFNLPDESADSTC